MNFIKQPWIWTFVIGIALGIYMGYHAGVVHGYEQALSLLKGMTR